MSKWEFKRVSTLFNDKTVLGDLLPQQLRLVAEYEKALEVAVTSKVANPKFSNYFCKESIGVAERHILPAGNIEYGLCQALHGEESAVAAFRAFYGRNIESHKILGIVSNGDPGNMAAPCGNCRDIMLDDLGRDLEIVCGPENGGVAVIARLSDYLFDRFGIWRILDNWDCTDESPLFGSEEISRFNFVNQVLDTVVTGQLLENDAYSPKGFLPERKYYVLLVTQKNKFYGAHHIMCDYHPVYAIERAILKALDIEKDPFIHHIVIVTKDGPEGFNGVPPHVMYRDRQHLYELNLYQELLLGREVDPPVYLVKYNTNKNLNSFGRILKTSIKEWLPLPFSVRHFGPEFLESLTKYQKERQ